MFYFRWAYVKITYLTIFLNQSNLRIFLNLCKLLSSNKPPISVVIPTNLTICWALYSQTFFVHCLHTN
ncbi:hypothetical protein EAH78_24765 [Pseudomonas arsenicoxydans]|uniref:Uncharacterized protein n=1 Tax=Pseudomonas arsenicoxydans TaxID=702115 RepID=A0A502HLZ8_9PSED|nr:hypothetical protein EAH78_24765 [Pseudomonas arsenicoxydans]